MANTQAQLQDLLKSHGIRQTRSRMDVLSEFARQPHALSHSHLEKSLGDDHDRVTIYRTLTLFQEKGIVHQVPDDEGVMKYALCETTCGHDEHQHDHVHFKCNNCGKTNCIADARIPRISLPGGYQIHEQNLLMIGICNECSLN